MHGHNRMDPKETGQADMLQIRLASNMCYCRDPGKDVIKFWVYKRKEISKLTV